MSILHFGGETENQGSLTDNGQDIFVKQLIETGTQRKVKRSRKAGVFVTTRSGDLQALSNIIDGTM